MAQLIEAMIAPTPRSSKLRLLVAQTNKYNDDLSEWLLVIDNTSTMTTWVKDYQLSTIQQRRPEWKVASHQRYNTKTTYVVVLSINTLITCMVAGLCGLWPIGYPLNQCLDDLGSCWPIWPITYAVAGLCDLWPVWLSSKSTPYEALSSNACCRSFHPNA